MRGVIERTGCRVKVNDIKCIWGDITDRVGRVIQIEYLIPVEVIRFEIQQRRRSRLQAMVRNRYCSIASAVICQGSNLFIGRYVNGKVRECISYLSPRRRVLGPRYWNGS